jgi:putative transcriptional regulator
MEISPEMMTVIQRIKDIRTEKGLSQFELASRIGKNASSIGRLEIGKVNPSLRYLIDIAKGLEVDISEFFKK